MYVYGQLGIKLGHYTGFQYYSGLRVPRGQLQPGDLVFFHANSAGVPQHEGMYVGNGSFIHAPQTGDVVKISSLFETRYALAYVGAVRPYAAGDEPSQIEAPELFPTTEPAPSQRPILVVEEPSSAAPAMARAASRPTSRMPGCTRAIVAGLRS